VFHENKDFIFLFHQNSLSTSII